MSKGIEWLVVRARSRTEKRSRFMSTSFGSASINGLGATVTIAGLRFSTRNNRLSWELFRAGPATIRCGPPRKSVGGAESWPKGAMPPLVLIVRRTVRGAYDLGGEAKGVGVHTENYRPLRHCGRRLSADPRRETAGKMISGAPGADVGGTQ